MDFNYRKATLEDLDVLISLRKQQLMDEGEVPDKDITPYLREFFTEGFLCDTYICLLCEHDGKAIATCGMALYRVPPYHGNYSGKVGQIGNMYTHPDYRRKGIGSKLLEELVDEVRELGYEFIRVKASREGRFLYTTFGFDETRNLMELVL